MTDLTAAGYQTAAARYNHISETITQRKRELLDLIDALDAEYDAAWADLRRYEVKPGIPLPEFREHTAAAIDKILGV